jgi:hypothetical protein
MSNDQKYDIALSFAGEERDYVDRVANLLRERGVKVFYDLFEEADLWGKDLYAHLSEVYQKQAKFTVVFISKAYATKLWTNHERRSAQARAFQEAQEYILPARFDDTEIPGVLPTVGYVSLKGRSPDDFVSIITRKLISAGGSVPTELVRRDFSSLATSEKRPGSQFEIHVVDDEDTPIEGCQVIAQADNGTFSSLSTGVEGLAHFELGVRRPTTLLVGHPNFPAAVHEKVDPIGTMKISLPRIENIGSIAINRTGKIPGLNGRLSPILDSQKRTYIYANNIAINGGVGQPAAFNINVPLEFEDSDGSIVFATVKHINGDMTLIQYTKKPSN